MKNSGFADFILTAHVAAGRPALSFGKLVLTSPFQVAQFTVEHFSGMHNWYACSHARPTFCNVCRESLSGVTSHGLSCEGTVASSTCPASTRATLSAQCRWLALLRSEQRKLTPGKQSPAWKQGLGASRWERGLGFHWGFTRSSAHIGLSGGNIWALEKIV